MPYNLLHEAWIPVLRAGGTRDWIRPAQIAERENPPVRLTAARPDFNGALIQFLIGLVQTAYAPRTEREWRRRYETPPTPEELQEAFCKYVDGCEDAFNLDGDGRRFMQDPELGAEIGTVDDKDLVPISWMLLETPTKNTLKLNQDHFVKDRTDEKFSAPEAAMALLTMQLNAPGGGPGYRVSLRGMGPLTTVILGKDLWTTVWLNVLVSSDFEALAGKGRTSKPSGTEIEAVFPWLTLGQDAEDAGASTNDLLTTPHMVHAAQMYWGTPRRKWLVKRDDAYTHYHRRNRGIDYDNESRWRHPLSPQRNGKPEKVSGELSYRDWPAIASLTGTKAVVPAPVVQQFHRRFSSRAADARLWSFGYQIVNSNKAEAYREIEPPLLAVPFQHRFAFDELARKLLEGAEEATTGKFGPRKLSLRDALKNALFSSLKEPSDGGGWDKLPSSKSDAASNAVVPNTLARFWRDTEQAFYARLERARTDLDEEAEYEEMIEALRACRESWYCFIRKHVLRLFDEVTLWGTFRAKNPRSVGQARRELRGALGAPLKETLGIDKGYTCSRNEKGDDA